MGSNSPARRGGQGLGQGLGVRGGGGGREVRGVRGGGRGEVGGRGERGVSGERGEIRGVVRVLEVDHGGCFSSRSRRCYTCSHTRTHSHTHTLVPT